MLVQYVKETIDNKGALKYNGYKLLLIFNDVAISASMWTEWFHWKIRQIVHVCFCLAGCDFFV